MMSSATEISETLTQPKTLVGMAAQLAPLLALHSIAIAPCMPIPHSNGMEKSQAVVVVCGWCTPLQIFCRAGSRTHNGRVVHTTVLCVAHAQMAKP